jgi:hypothetical protein
MKSEERCKKPIEMRVCHCGKCKITCNLHGRRGKCAECGKTAILGTESRYGVVRHLCDKCCSRLIAEQEKKEKEELKKALDDMRKKTIDNNLRQEHQEKCIPTKQGQKCGLENCKEKAKRVKRKPKKPSTDE